MKPLDGFAYTVSRTGKRGSSGGYPSRDFQRVIEQPADDEIDSGHVPTQEQCQTKRPSRRTGRYI